MRKYMCFVKFACISWEIFSQIVNSHEIYENIEIYRFQRRKGLSEWKFLEFPDYEFR